MPGAQGGASPILTWGLVATMLVENAHLSSAPPVPPQPQSTGGTAKRKDVHVAQLVFFFFFSLKLRGYSKKTHKQIPKKPRELSHQCWIR